MKWKGKAGKKSIKAQLLSMVLFPILMLGALTIFIGISLIYTFYSNSVHDELAATSKMLLNCLDLTVRGDYQYVDEMLMKGNINITDSTMLYRIKEESNIDTSIFWHDKRILTTVESESGVSAVGTIADADVKRTVLDKGESYFSENIQILDEKYIGYYAPISNSSEGIVGMMFAGKKKTLVYFEIGKLIIWFILFSGIVMLLGAFLSKKYSGTMILDIATINQYLKNISYGDLDATLDERIEKRQDEIGEIGTYATRMRQNLQQLIEMDPLTSLLNRRSCNQKIHSLMEEKDIFTVVMCDIDWFKKINDNYGHDAGDYVLKVISLILQNTVDGCGFASRWGGEEFLLIFTLPLDKALPKVESLQKEVRKFLFSYENNEFRVTMTFGVEERAESLMYEQLIREADNKLYIGKNSGRDRIVS